MQHCEDKTSEKIVTPYSKESFLNIIAGNVFVSILTRVAGFLFTLSAALMMDPTDFGLFIIGLGILTMFGTLAGLGAPSALNYFSTILIEKNQVEVLRSIILRSTLAVLIISCFCATLLILISGWISETIYNNSEIATFIKIAALAIPSFSCFRLFTGILRGLQRTVLATFLETTIWRWSHLLLLITLVGNGLNAQEMMLGIVFISITLMLWALLSIKKLLFGRFDSVDQEIKRTYNHYAFDSWVTSLVNSAVARSEVVFLGFFVMISDVSIFAVASSIASFLLVGSMILSPAFRPAATRLIASNAIEEFVELYKLMMRLNVVVIMPVAIYLFLFSSSIVDAMFDDRYSEVSNILLILILGIVPRLLLGPANPTLLAMGHAKKIRQITLLSTALYFFAFVPLAYNFGLVGAAIATSIYGVTQQLLKNYHVRTVVKVPWLPEHQSFRFLCLVLMFCSALKLCNTIGALRFNYDWLVYFAIFLIGTVIFASLMGLLDKIMILKIAKKLLLKMAMVKKNGQI